MKRFVSPERLTTPIVYEVDEGRAYLVLTRPSEPDPTEHCHFCGWRHFHGTGDGHRIEHCLHRPYWHRGRLYVPRTMISAPDGTQLYQEHGYIVRTLGTGAAGPTSGPARQMEAGAPEVDTP